MVDGHGKEYQVKKHKDKERYYIQTATGQLTVTSIVNSNDDAQDFVYNYIFNRGFITHPCPAMAYWIYRHRLKNNITPQQYKIKFNIKPPHR